VNPDVRGDVVTFDGGGPALTPGASQVQVVGRFPAHMGARKTCSCRMLDADRRNEIEGSPGGHLHRVLRVKCSAHRSFATGIADFRQAALTLAAGGFLDGRLL